MFVLRCSERPVMPQNYTAKHPKIMRMFTSYQHSVKRESHIFSSPSHATNRLVEACEFFESGSHPMKQLRCSKENMVSSTMKHQDFWENRQLLIYFEVGMNVRTCGWNTLSIRRRHQSARWNGPGIVRNFKVRARNQRYERKNFASNGSACCACDLK